MLSRVAVKNYALIDAIELEFGPGLSVLTGETGAGKSILLGALGLALGERADRDAVRSGADRADVSAFFDGVAGTVSAWLAERDLQQDGECQLRRVVLADGGSRAYINGTPVPVAQLRELGRLLIEVHGQRENQHLAASTTQRDLVDRYGEHETLLGELTTLARRYGEIRDAIEALSIEGADPNQLEFLRFQIAEFDGVDVAPEAIAELEAAHRRQAGAEEILAACAGALDSLRGDDALLNGLHEARRRLAGVKGADGLLDEAIELLESAALSADEAAQSLSRAADGLSLDPAMLAEQERKLGVLHDLARKHRVGIRELQARHDALAAKLERAGGWESEAEALRKEAEKIFERWRALAAKLTRARKKAAKSLTSTTNGLLSEIAMEGATVTARHSRLDIEAPTAHGADTLELLVTTNAGQKPGAIGKIASGGELARISLALKVATSREGSAASLIFDEVDAGVGGATAEVVGRLLRRVADHHQVLSVTHLPQVAAQADHQYRVSKIRSQKDTKTQVDQLIPEQREEELARMLGGVEITGKTLDHARDMLQRARG